MADCIAEFDSVIQKYSGNGYISSGDYSPLAEKTRKMVRKYRIKDAEQVFRLALEYVPSKLDFYLAVMLRKNVIPVCREIR